MVGRVFIERRDRCWFRHQIDEDGQSVPAVSGFKTFLELHTAWAASSSHS